MSQQLNQFSMATLKGVLSMIFSPNTISVTVDPDSTATLVPGSFVKLTTTAGKAIQVDVAAATDVAIGVVVANQKKISFVANDSVSIAIDGSVITLEASAAINRGVGLEYVASGAKVKTNAGVNPVCGIALDPAAGNGSLFRALVRCASITGLVSALGSVVTALTPGATAALDATKGETFTLTPDQATALTVTGGVAGQKLSLVVTTSGTTSYAVSFSTGFLAGTANLVTGIVTAQKFTVNFRHNGTSFVETSRTFGPLGSPVTALTPGEAVAIDATLGNTFTLVPAAAVDLSITGGVAGQLVTLIVTTSGASSFNVTPGTGFAKTAGVLATGTDNGKVFTLSFRHNGTGFVETGRTAAM